MPLRQSGILLSEQVASSAGNPSSPLLLSTLPSLFVTLPSRLGRLAAGFSLCFFLLMQANAQTPASAGPSRPVKFTKKPIASESFESVGVFDVNNDGHLDIVSGTLWYEGPHFWARNFIGDVPRYEQYYDDFSTIPFDVNGDGYLDFVTGGWFGKSLRWHENPGKEKVKQWAVHPIADIGNVETTYGWDIDGDGINEIVPNTPNNPLLVFRHDPATKSFVKYQIADSQDHGLGFGDVNGDGRPDLVISKGWLEAPANPWKDKWIFHQEFDLQTASIPVIVADVNGDGLTDLISGVAHGYGLDWYEQRIDKKTKKRSWIKHPIDPFNSLYHTMQWTDIDNDGQPELVTGKRYRAHDGRDPGEEDDLGLYYFKWNGEHFMKHVISYGPYGTGKGAGLYFSIADLRKTGRKDIIVAGKDGLCIFFNEGH